MSRADFLRAIGLGALASWLGWETEPDLSEFAITTPKNAEALGKAIYASDCVVTYTVNGDHVHADLRTVDGCTHVLRSPLGFEDNLRSSKTIKLWTT